ncbi:hypothetical protein [uncultured Variovorax sp.]|uniref:hypothetical protein n=1 Tax=uncultured Variovorax sp. TaxID=114708 RepID=UPI0025D49403|nr:hypothetical protein [uncultured Variovorax sp.]
MRVLPCVFLALGLLGLSACDKAKEGFSEGFDSAFKTSFRESFIASCVHSAGERRSEEDRKKLCTCAADGVMKDASVADLQDAEKIRSRSGPIVQQCLKQL